MSRRRTRPWPTYASRTPLLSPSGFVCECRETYRQFSAPPAGPLAELRLSSPRGNRPSRGTGGCTRTALATGRLRPLEERGGNARVPPDLQEIAHRPAVSRDTTARAGPLLPLAGDRGSTLRLRGCTGISLPLWLMEFSRLSRLARASECCCGRRARPLLSRAMSSQCRAVPYRAASLGGVRTRTAPPSWLSGRSTVAARLRRPRA